MLSAADNCLVHVSCSHASLCGHRSALESFAEEAHSIRTGADITTSRLQNLVDKHRFLRSVFSFHSASEDEVLLPAARFAQQTYCAMRAF